MIALISIGHFFSHYYILVLAPLFPLLARDLGVGYGRLGVALGLLNATTAVLQPPIGFLVDRYGPAKVLIGGQALFAIAITGVGWFADYEALLLMMLLAGLANAVYHPADYAVLAARVGSRRVGRAFSVHTFGGYLGFAVAPATIVPLAAWIGWRTALELVGALGLLVALLLWMFRDLLEVRPQHAAGEGRGLARDLRFLMTAPVLVSLIFFTLLAMSQTGFNSFTVVFLKQVYGWPIVQASAPLTAFLAASTLGVLLGGWVADHTRHHDHVVGACFLSIAVLAALLASRELPFPVVLVMFGAAGMAFGAVAPSRDMLVRSITPRGASGRVFGFVTTGFNIGGFLAPPLFGYIVDEGMPRWVFGLVALLALITVLSVLWTARIGRRRSASGGPGE